MRSASYLEAAKALCLGKPASYFSSSRSFSTFKDSSQPTSIRTLTPPSSSRSDCEAVDSESAPCKGQKVNIVLSPSDYLVQRMFEAGCPLIKPQIKCHEGMI